MARNPENAKRVLSRQNFERMAYATCGAVALWSIYNMFNFFPEDKVGDEVGLQPTQDVALAEYSVSNSVATTTMAVAQECFKVAGAAMAFANAEVGNFLSRYAGEHYDEMRDNFARYFQHHSELLQNGQMANVANFTQAKDFAVDPNKLTAQAVDLLIQVRANAIFLALEGMCGGWQVTNHSQLIRENKMPCFEYPTMANACDALSESVGTSESAAMIKDLVSQGRTLEAFETIFESSYWQHFGGYMNHMNQELAKFPGAQEVFANVLQDPNFIQTFFEQNEKLLMQLKKEGVLDKMVDSVLGFFETQVEAKKTVVQALQSVLSTIPRGFEPGSPMLGHDDHRLKLRGVEPLQSETVRTELR